MCKKIDSLKYSIINAYSQLRQVIESKYYIEIEAVVHFQKGKDNYPSGTYVFADEKGFHIEYVGDRGGIVNRIDTNSEFEAKYKICSELISSMAFKYCLDNKETRKDGRRILFEKELDWLKILGKDYYQKGYSDIENILKEHPYNDEKLG